MPDIDFLLTYSLYRKFQIELPPDGKIPEPPLNLFCRQCKREHTFVVCQPYYNIETLHDEGRPRSVMPRQSYQTELPQKAQILRVDYRCMGCKEFQQSYFIRFNETRTVVMKVGQYPAWGITLDSETAKIIHPYEEIYKHGLICEFHGFGIAALAYYRRIVEKTIDQLLAFIPDLMNEHQKMQYQIAFQDIETTIVAQDKIRLVKDLLPDILRPNDMNPLDILHQALSEGLHELSEDECMNLAVMTRNSILFLIAQIIQNRETKKKFTDSMQNFLERRQQRLENSKKTS